jgi:hypothetical protein
MRGNAVAGSMNSFSGRIVAQLGGLSRELTAICGACLGLYRSHLPTLVRFLTHRAIQKKKMMRKKNRVPRKTNPSKVGV